MQFKNLSPERCHCCYRNSRHNTEAPHRRLNAGAVMGGEAGRRASLGELGRIVGRRPFGYFWDGPTLGVCQKYLAVKAKPLVQLDTCNGYVHEAFNWPAYISNPCMKSFYGFRPYGGSLLSNSHKSKQKGLAPAYGPRCAQVPLAPVPLRGHAATGHPWPDRSSPGIHAGRRTPQNLHSASRRGGRSRSRSKAKSKARSKTKSKVRSKARSEARS